MAANYPSTAVSFSQRTDNQDPVVAGDVNVVYDEVTAIATVIGLSPASSAGWSGSFSTSTTSWSTLKERIQHIEYGLSTAYTDRVSLAGDSVVLPAANKVGVTVKAAPSATSNLMEFKNSSNTVVTAVGPNGWILTIDGGSAA
jgi:hypothetical protein